MAEITISELPSKTMLLDSDMVPIDDGTQSYRVTGAQLREFLKVNFLPLGTVVWSQSNLATDNAGRLPLWTGEYIASASTLYPDFYAWIKKHSELLKTKTQYNAALSAYGECPYYVVDEVQGSLRLPKLANYIKVATNGITQSGAGLPNITGRLRFEKNGYGAIKQEQSGALNSEAGSGNAESSGVSGANQNATIILDASKSNSIYGKSSTVTPAHTTLYPWVCAYNAAIPASVAQAAEFQTGLTSKADTGLSNVSTNGKEIMSSMSMPSNKYVDLTLGASGTRYTAPANGWIQFTHRTNAAGSFIGLHNNTSGIAHFQSAHSTGQLLRANLPVKKGDSFLIEYSSSAENAAQNTFRFIYAEGAK